MQTTRVQTGTSLQIDAPAFFTSDLSRELLAGQQLAGMALGLRGQLSRYLSYDLFLSRPLSQPEGFSKNKAVTGFTVSAEY